MKYNFDEIIDRRGTNAVKTDNLNILFGRNDITPLWVADMDFAVLPEITEALHRRLDHPIYGYSTTPDSYWQAVIDWQRERNGFTLERDDLLHVPGIVKGVTYVINFYTRVGDKVVIQPPVYYPFRIVTELSLRKVIENPLRRIDAPDGTLARYEMDLEGLERIFAEEQPKIMVLCNPHNPVGICWKADTLREVAHLAKKYGVIVVSDEIHGDLAHKGHHHLPFATVSDDAAEVAITFGAPTKTFNVAGIVGSWCAVKNPELRKGFFEWMTNCGFAEASMAATITAETAYRHGSEWLAQLMEYLDGNIDFVVDFLEKNIPQIKAIRPEASFLVWLDCRALNLDHDALIHLMVDEAHLAMNDGAMFGSQGTGFMRLNVGCPRSILADALDRMAHAVNSL